MEINEYAKRQIDLINKKCKSIKPLVVIRAVTYNHGRYIREVDVRRFLVERINERRLIWNVKVFLSDVPNALEGHKIEAEIIGTVRDWRPSEDEWFVIGISTSSVERKDIQYFKL